MQASLLMSRDVVTCRSDATLAEAARLMRENGVGFLPVLGTQRQIEGVLTDRDALLASASTGKPLTAVGVREAMKKMVVSCSPDADLDLVERLLAGARLHRLPVTDDDGQLLGVISIDDLAMAALRKGDPEFQRRVALTLGEIVQRRAPDGEPD